MQAKEGEAAEAAALQLVTSLKEQGLLRAFGGARQVPKRQYTLEDLRLNRIEPQKFLSPTDNTLTTVRTVLQVHAPVQAATSLPSVSLHRCARAVTRGLVCACASHPRGGACWR